MASNEIGNLAPYLRQAITTFHNGFDSEEMKKIFLDNVFDEISGNELKIMLMKSTTCIMEKLVTAASVENLLQLFKVMHIYYIKAFSFDIIITNRKPKDEFPNKEKIIQGPRIKQNKFYYK